MKVKRFVLFVNLVNPDFEMRRTRMRDAQAFGGNFFENNHSGIIDWHGNFWVALVPEPFFAMRQVSIHEWKRPCSDEICGQQGSISSHSVSFVLKSGEGTGDWLKQYRVLFVVLLSDFGTINSREFQKYLAVHYSVTAEFNVWPRVNVW